MLASDSGSFQSQLIYHECVKIKKSENRISFGFTELNELFPSHLNNEFTIKVKAGEMLQFEPEGLRIIAQSLAKQEGVFLHILKFIKENDTDVSASVRITKI